MKLALWLPIVNFPPALQHADWERDGGIDDIAAVATAADRLGYAYLCAPEHVALPSARKAVRGGRYWDPLSTLGYVAAVTHRIGLVTLVIVLGYHHPLAIAKRVGTLDRVCKGRVVLGVGVGTLEEEFALLGAPFEGRGARADDALRALHAAMGQDEPSYQGTHYQFSGMIVDPGLRAETPVWVGGQSARSLRRAVELGDGWAPFSLTAQQMGALLADPGIQRQLAQRTKPFEVMQVWGGANSVRLDPLGRPQEAEAALRESAAAGVTTAMPYLASTSRDHYIDQMAALARIAGRLA